MSSRLGWLTIAALVAGSEPASAETPAAAVVVNLAGEPAARAAAEAEVTAVRRGLAERGLVRALPPELAEVVEGETALRGFQLDLEPVRQAYAGFAYDRAQELLEQASEEVLDRAPEGQLGRFLGEILFWRGKVAVAAGDRAAAARWFAGAIAVAPAVHPDPAVDPPLVVRAFARARRRRAPPAGVVAITASAGTLLRVDQQPAQPAAGELSLPAGLHLLVLTAPGRERRAALVEVPARGRIEVDGELPVESRAHQVARAIAVAGAVAPGAARLSALGSLGGLLGARRLVVIEAGDQGGLVARLYDLDAATASAPVALGDPEAMAMALGLVTPPPAELKPPPEPEQRADLVAVPARRERDRPWYRRWWLWSVVGAAAATTTVLILTRDQSTELVCCGAP